MKRALIAIAILALSAAPAAARPCKHRCAPSGSVIVQEGSSTPLSPTVYAIEQEGSSEPLSPTSP